jgi:CheY-like chemotaxis protein
MKTVLVIGYNKNGVDHISGAVAKEGIKIEWVESNEEGLLRFTESQEKYSAIIMKVFWDIPSNFTDQQRKKANNWLAAWPVVADVIREKSPNIPIIYYSAWNPSGEIKFDEYTYYIPSPETEENISDILLRALKGPKTIEEKDRNEKNLRN